MEFQLENFRRFHFAWADLRPITVLVGENSSGKSSFLAGVRYFFDLLAGARGNEASFNREPFFLGAYDQIAHFRGGSFGRAPKFQITLRFTTQELARISPRGRARAPLRNLSERPIEVSVSFENEKSQPAICEVSFEFEDIRIHISKDTLPGFRIEKGDRVFEINRKEREVEIATERLHSNLNDFFSFSNPVFDWAWGRSRHPEPSGDQPPVELAQMISTFLEFLLLIPASFVYASAPFRTRPERTYSPIDVTSSAEGTHIPLILAQMKSFDSARWGAIKETLEKFGNSSGMFKTVDVKRLGRSDSDPFQLIVTVEKNRANIIDVGYGVSQVLPILVETVFNREAGMFLFQQPEVHLHPKGQAELGSFFVDFASTKNKYVMIETHSDYIIDRIRSEIVRRKLDPDKFLSLLYFDRDDLETWISKIRVGEEGQIQNPPEKYRKFFLDESLRVMGLDQ